MIHSNNFDQYFVIFILLFMLASIVAVTGFGIYVIISHNGTESEYQTQCMDVCVEEFGYTFHSYLSKELRQCWCLNDGGEPVMVPVDYG